MLAELREYIDYCFPLSDTEWEEFSSLFTVVQYKKDEYIYGASEVNTHLYFIIDGLVRSFTIENNKEFTWVFHCLDVRAVKHRMLIDIMVTDYVSFTQGVPEKLYFEVMRDATLVKIDKEDLLTLYQRSPRWQQFATKMAEDAYALLRERTLNLLTKSAKERVKLLLEYFPLAFEFGIPTEYLSTYLGMTRQTLNRIKKELGY